MKKICFVAECMYCGGTEKSLLSLLQYLDRTKYDITLLLLQKKGDLFSQLPDDIRVEVIPLADDETDDLLSGRTNALVKSIKRGRFITAGKKAIRGLKLKMGSKYESERRLNYYLSIENKIAEYPEPFDIVIDYMGYGLFNTFYAARKVKGKKKISWVHFEPNEAMPDFFVFEELLDEYDHIFCVSQSSQKQILDMMPSLTNKTQVFYNIVNDKDIHEKAQEFTVDRDDRINILSIGRLDPQKNFDSAISVIDRLIGEGYKLTWNIIGEGWQRPHLENLINNTRHSGGLIHLLGQQLNPYPFLASCDMYFQPSRHEGYCIALAEARAFDKPIIATNFAGALEQLHNGKTGIITECDNESIYQGLKTLLDSPDMRAHLSDNLAKEHKEFPPQIKLLTDIIDGI